MLSDMPTRMKPMAIGRVESNGRVKSSSTLACCSSNKVMVLFVLIFVTAIGYSGYKYMNAPAPAGKASNHVFRHTVAPTAAGGGGGRDKEYEYEVEYESTKKNTRKKKTSAPTKKKKTSAPTKKKKTSAPTKKKTSAPTKEKTSAPTKIETGAPTTYDEYVPSTKEPTLEPTKAAVNSLPFSVDDLSEKVDAMKTMLEEYYGGTKMLFGGMGAPPGTPTHARGIDRLVDKIARAFVYGKKFTIGAIGSSVTAGHDNCNFDSYPRQLKRQLQPIWDAAGVEWDVRNAGQGGGCGDDHNNQVFCFANTVGTDVDIIHYSWTYFSGAVPGWTYEALFRWAATLDNSPIVHALNVNSDGRAGTCRTRFGGEQFWKQYGENGFQSYCFAQALEAGGHWNGHENGHVGDGLHSFTRYAADYDAKRKSSTGVVYRNWHPGPLGFQMASDLMAYDILLGMQLAIRKIGVATKAGKDLAQIFPNPPPLFDLSKLGSAIKCDPELCEVEYAPGCHNWETPTFAKPQIWPRPADDDMNPNKDLARPGDTGWKTGKDGRSQHLIPRDEITLPECKHLDFCGWLQPRTPKNGGWQTFLLPRLNVGFISVCCCCSKECAAEFKKPGNVQMRFAGKDLDVQKMDYWPNQKCLRVQPRFDGPVDPSRGHLHLAINFPGDFVGKISHIIAM